MNTLRAKIALLLVVAIVSVVGILTWVMIAMLGPPVALIEAPNARGMK